MQRGGPRGTIPPPSERHRAGPRWPLQVLVGVGVIGAVFLGMRLMRDESSPAPSATSGRASPGPSNATPAPASNRGERDAPRAVSAATPTPYLDAFVGQLQRAQSYAFLGDIAVPESIRAS